MAGSSKDPHLNKLHTEFYARFMQVILESRIPSLTSVPSHSQDGSTSTSSHRVQGPAFNIVLGKFGAVIDSMEPWCKGIQDPMVIDILFSRCGHTKAVEGCGRKIVQGAGNLVVQTPAGIAFVTDSGSEQLILLERWTVDFVRLSSRSSGKAERETKLQVQKGMIGQHLRGTQNCKLLVGWSGNNDRDEIAAAYNVVEKKMAILLRSTYCTARLLPAQNLFRFLRTSRNCNFKLSYKIMASPLGSNIKDMTQLSFTPIETCGGCLQVSVIYRQKNPSTEHETTYALCPKIIKDYVGSAASLQSKKPPSEGTGHFHSLPLSHQRLSSFKFDNLQRHRVPNKKVAVRELDHAHTASRGCGDFSSVEDEGFECPFASHDEQYDNRMESAKLTAVKSDLAGYGRTVSHVPGGALEVFLACQIPAAPLSGSHQTMKDAACSLKELKMYIDLKDSFLK